METRKAGILSLLTILLVGLIYLLPTEKALAQEQAPQPSTDAREDFSDTELSSFVKAYQKVTEIQKESEQKIIKVIEGEGLSVDRFNEILEAQRDPQKKADASPEELNSFNSAAQVIVQENQEAEKQMVTSIEKEGINIDTYQEIVVAYQQNPTVQGKINKLLSGEN